MTNWRLSAVAILLGIGTLLFVQTTHRPRGQPGPTTPDAAVTVAGRETPKTTSSERAQSSTPASGVEQPSDPAPTALTARTSPLPPSPAPTVADTPESINLTPMTILENMRTTIRQYRSRYGGNPVGNNFEITSALSGDNPKQINFLKQDGNRLNANGELVDPWGSPYFFHQISGQEMEIRSAGPDRVMYTDDDLVTR
jgi:hypothetical protein